MMTLLLRREVFTPHWQAPRSDMPAAPTDIWLGLFVNDAGQTPIGFVNVHTEPTQRADQSGMIASVMGQMRLNLGSFKGELRVNGHAWATERDGFREFMVTMRSGEHETTVDGTVEEGRLLGTMTTGGERTPFDLPFTDNQVLTNAPGLNALGMPDIEVGEEIVVDAFDPLTMSSGNARIRCIREEVITIMDEAIETKVLVTELSGITSTAWVDESGNVVRAETPIGIVFQRMDELEARRSMLASNAQGDGLLKLAAVAAIGQAPFRGATRMEVVLSGIDGAMAVPSDDAQTLHADGRLVITPLGPVEMGAPLDADTRAKALANDIFLQIDHPRIVQAANEIVAGKVDDWEKSVLIHEWVSKSVRKGIVPSLPTALDVLTTLEGDCNEHTMLFTALARASGIPTRMAIGIVWSEEFNAFYYHAWPEVYAGRWVWMDPTLDQVVADATHIKLISGDLSEWWKVAPFMGKIEVRIVDIE